MTKSSMQIVHIIDTFLAQNPKIQYLYLLPDIRYGFIEGVYWCVEQLMSRNDITESEALDMLGIVEAE